MQSQAAMRVEKLSEDVTLYLGDCREIAPTLQGVDAVVSDPPYGMNWNTDHSRFKPGPNGTGAPKAVDWKKPVAGDAEPFDPTPWLAYEQVILWGSNHFGSRLPVGTTLIWLKRLDGGFGSFLSDAEMAWMRGGHGIYCKRDLSLQGESSRRAHPTQKPLPLMEWCIGLLKGTPRTILDPYMGSGTTGIAAVRLGRCFVGVEIDPGHFDTACRRIADELARPMLFAANDQDAPRQEALGI